MKLSEAIRLGAQKRPQIQGRFTAPLADGSGMGTCAMGAAIEAAIGHPFDSTKDDAIDILNTLLPKDSPSIQALQVAYPAPFSVKHDKASLNVVISQLNDRYNWTRERIADWLESINF